MRKPLVQVLAIGLLLLGLGALAVALAGDPGLADDGLESATTASRVPPELIGLAIGLAAGAAAWLARRGGR